MYSFFASSNLMINSLFYVTSLALTNEQTLFIFYEVWVCILMLEFSFASLEHLLKKNATKVVPGFLLKLLGK